METLKILIVHNHYKTTYIGGEDIVFKREVEALKGSIGDENVFTYERHNQNSNIFDVIWSILFSFKTFFEVRKIIQNNNINLVHCHNFFPLISPSVFLSAKLSGIKTVLTLHNFRPWCIAGTFYRNDIGACELCANKRAPFKGIIHKCFRNSYFQSIAAQVAFTFYRFIGAYKWIDQYFVLSEFQKKKLLQLNISEHKIQIKQNFVPEMKNNVSYEPKDKTGYLYIGRPSKGKGLELLLKTWLHLDDCFELTVVGDIDSKSDLLKKYYKKNISFIGSKNIDEISLLLSKSKYLIQPSLFYETFGLTIVESFMCGTPVIGFNIGSRPNLIKNNINGLLCETTNLQKTLEISFASEDYNELCKGALNASLVYREDFVINRQLMLYHNLIGN